MKVVHCPVRMCRILGQLAASQHMLALFLVFYSNIRNLCSLLDLHRWLCCVCPLRLCDNWVQCFMSASNPEPGGAQLLSGALLRQSSRPYGLWPKPLWHRLPQTQGNTLHRYRFSSRYWWIKEMKKGPYGSERFDSLLSRLVTSSASSVSLRWASGQACWTTKWVTSSSFM